ncbi:MAG: helix-turn-helix domain-containing protein, partial [Paracoccaceae bacterium]|nr:helix-turn-helix domain-containing protein [Paracoccaceae bacterium]
ITQADWPGNVRQLRNAADRFVMGLDDYEDPAPNATGTLSERVAAYEKQVIIAELSSRGGSLKDTYEALRISRKSLYEKMQRYGLKREDYKD